MLLYADDTALLMKEKHLGKLYSGMEHNLFLTDLWLRSNKLSLNSRKSMFSIFNMPKSIDKRLIPSEIKMGKYTLKHTECYTYLGLDIDVNLKFERHVNKTIKTCAYRTSQLYRLRPYLTEFTSKLIFTSMILPIIDNYSNYYLSCNKCYKDKLNVIFKRGVRVIKKLPKRTSTEQVIVEMKLNNLTERRLENLLLFAYETTKDNNKIDNRVIHTRAHDEGRKQLIVPTTRNTVYRKSYNYKSVIFWNELETEYHMMHTRKELSLYIRNNLLKLKEKFKEGIG